MSEMKKQTQDPLLTEDQKEKLASSYSNIKVFGIADLIDAVEAACLDAMDNRIDGKQYEFVPLKEGEDWHPRTTCKSCVFIGTPISCAVIKCYGSERRDCKTGYFKEIKS